MGRLSMSQVAHACDQAYHGFQMMAGCRSGQLSRLIYPILGIEILGCAGVLRAHLPQLNPPTAGDRFHSGREISVSAFTSVVMDENPAALWLFFPSRQKAERITLVRDDHACRCMSIFPKIGPNTVIDTGRIRLGRLVLLAGLGMALLAVGAPLISYPYVTGGVSAPFLTHLREAQLLR